jgi:acyl carrier protein
MPVLQDVLHVLDHALQLQGRAHTFNPETPLLGALPELDSMAVLSVLTGLEEHLGIAFDDADIQGDVFATVGSLCNLVTNAQARTA